MCHQVWCGCGLNVAVVALVVCLRETEEECGLVVRDLDKVGVILFEFTGQPQLMEVHVFRTTCYSGHPTETEGAAVHAKKKGADLCMS